MQIGLHSRDIFGRRLQAFRHSLFEEYVSTTKQLSIETMEIIVKTIQEENTW